MRKKKVLVVRFNSIGDIVLTFPAVRALSESDFEVHYLTKNAYASLLSSNPRIDKIWSIGQDVSEVLSELKTEAFSHVVDLHNNLRSRRLKRSLSAPASTLKKYPIQNYFLTQWNLKLKDSPYIVSRFLDVVSNICSTEKQESLEFFIPQEVVTAIDALDLPKEFVAISVGAAYKTKQIPIDTLVKVINQLKLPVVLLGGKVDAERATQILNQSTDHVISLVGAVDLLSSAEIIRRSKSVLTGDTGLMHIAAALKKNLVAVFGSTHPTLGYAPTSPDDSFNYKIVQNENLSCRPCTKQGKNKCPKGHFKCMKDIKPSTIIASLHSL